MPQSDRKVQYPKLKFGIDILYYIKTRNIFIFRKFILQNASNFSFTRNWFVTIQRGDVLYMEASQHCIMTKVSCAKVCDVQSINLR